MDNSMTPSTPLTGLTVSRALRALRALWATGSTGPFLRALRALRALTGPYGLYRPSGNGKDPTQKCRKGTSKRKWGSECWLMQKSMTTLGESMIKSMNLWKKIIITKWSMSWWYCLKIWVAGGWRQEYWFWSGHWVWFGSDPLEKLPSFSHPRVEGVGACVC